MKKKNAMRAILKIIYCMQLKFCLLDAPNANILTRFSKDYLITYPILMLSVKVGGVNMNFTIYEFLPQRCHIPKNSQN